MVSVNIAALVLRLVVGGTMMAHGWNHAFGGGKLPGTARWFESVGIRPGRVHALAAAHGRSPGDPHFDPVWARLNEAGVTVAFHIMENWYNEAIAPAWGLDAWPGSWHMSAWQWNNLYGERPITDTLSALIFDNLFGRFPDLNVLVAEFGASWVPHFTGHMDKSRGMGRNGPWIGGKLTERPSAIFRRHVRVAPYPEDDIPKIVRDLPDADCLVMGSDFPHAEGLAEPAGFAALLDGLPEAQQRQILRDNAAKLLATSQPGQQPL